MKTMTPEAVRRKIQQAGNGILFIRFIRRNDKVVDGRVVARAGEVREMTCRLHVTEGVKGLQPDRPQQDRANKVLTVFEMGPAGGFKCVPLDSVIEIRLAIRPVKSKRKET